MGRLALIAAAVGTAAFFTGSAAPETERTITVRVTMTRVTCKTAPAIVEPGDVAFRIANRTRRLRLFTIGGRRSRYVRPGRTGSLSARLVRPGLYRFFCLSRGRIRNPRTGVLAVRGQAPARQPPPHLIALRPGLGGALELFDRASGQVFVPRGANYVRLSQQGDVGLYHSTFNVGEYSGSRAEQALSRMRAGGSNVVRVFLNGRCRDACIGNPTRGISAAYVANLAAFLRLAKANGLYVILTIDGLPVGTRYETTLNAQARTFVDGVNVNFLTAGGVQANAAFWSDFVGELVRQEAPTDVILAYELRNEAYFDSSAKPFTLTSGLLPAPGGRTYDLSIPAQKDLLVDEGLAFWIDRVRSAIRAVDPTALVAMGFFEPQTPNQSRVGDPRLIRTRAAIRSSSVDVVDLHAYPGLELTLPEYMENFGVDGSETKPVLIGELGAFKSAFPALDEAPFALQSWQRDSCRFGVDGWLVWTWDTDEQPELWNSLSGGAAIEQALAPVERPDPCSSPVGPHNVALGRPATASGSQAGAPAGNAFDGDRQTLWSAGALAPQWIEVDLGSPQRIARVRLHVAQLPDGYTIHRVYGRKSAGGPQLLLHEFGGFTRSGDVLAYTPATAWEDVRYLRVETIASPSWVAWREIEVVSAG